MHASPETESIQVVSDLLMQLTPIITEVCVREVNKDELLFWFFFCDQMLTIQLL